jgi:hypothetical protein
MHLKQKEYNFQIIDINGNDNLEDSDESIDSEEGCFEIHENHNMICLNYYFLKIM